MALDPVCGMTVDPEHAAGHFEYKGETYYFCAKSCAAKFSADPERYLAPRPGSAGGADVPPVDDLAARPQPASTRQPAGATRYTCPMDPEVISDRPGACPKCGMALEPMITSLSDLPMFPIPNSST